MNYMKTSGVMKPNDGVYLKAQKNLGNTSSNCDSPAQSAELYCFTSYNSSLLCSVKNVEFSDYSCEVKIKTIFK